MSQIRSAIFAALVVAVIPAAWFLLFQATTEHSLLSDQISLAGFSLLIYCYSVGIALICGYSTLLLLRCLALVRWWTASLAGVLWGYFLMRLFAGTSTEISAIATWAAIGGLCGFTYWGVWWRAIEQN